jgi:predicted GNAT family acetyltransferase
VTSLASRFATETGGFGVRSLTVADLPRIQTLIHEQPVAHCFLASRLLTPAGTFAGWGGEAWGYVADDTITGGLFLGANVVPLATDAQSRAAFAARLRLTGRRGSSIVGYAEEVLDLWRLIEPGWGKAREIRPSQPLLAIDGAPSVAPDPHVRRVRSDEIDVLLPACISMFTEEVGVSPVSGGLMSAYRSRISELIAEGRALAHIEDGRVIFKAEIGAASAQACQVQGVWVEPKLRQRGLAAPGMAAVVDYARRAIAPTVSLYVNDFNTAARRTYERVGFREIGTFATILL